MPHLPRQRLTVYTRALEFVRDAEMILARIPAERAWLRDQLQRAAASIVLNIAEGSGEFRPKEKARFYRIALRSATECLSVLDVLQSAACVDEVAVNAGRDTLDEVVAMLVKLCGNLERRG